VRTSVLVLKNFTKVEVKRVASARPVPAVPDLGVLPMEACAPAEILDGALAPRLPTSRQIIVEPSLSSLICSQPSSFDKGWKLNLVERLNYTDSVAGFLGTLRFFGWFIIPDLESR